MNNSIFSNLPNDIIIEICKQNKINKQNELYKKRHNILIKHLNEYFYEHVDEDDTELDLNYEIFFEGDIRCDVRFLDDNDLWETSYYKAISDRWGGEPEFEEWIDNCF